MKLSEARIFCTGTGATGKTSVVDLIRKLVPELEHRPSPARAVHARYGVTEQNQHEKGPELLRNIQQDIFQEGCSQAEAPGGCIADRSPLCNFAYALQRSHREMADPSLVRSWEERLKECVARMDVLAYFPFPTPWVEESLRRDDDFRLTSYASWRAHDLLIRSVMADLELYDRTEVVEVCFGTPVERAVHVLEVVRQL